MSEFLQGSILVVGHGKKHQVIKELVYSKSIFLDRNPICDPDIVADFKKFNIENQ